jgi:hypothetical protein
LRPKRPEKVMRCRPFATYRRRVRLTALSLGAVSGVAVGVAVGAGVGVGVGVPPVAAPGTTVAAVLSATAGPVPFLAGEVRADIARLDREGRSGLPCHGRAVGRPAARERQNAGPDAARAGPTWLPARDPLRHEV